MGYFSVTARDKIDTLFVTQFNTQFAKSVVRSNYLRIRPFTQIAHKLTQQNVATKLNLSPSLCLSVYLF